MKEYKRRKTRKQVVCPSHMGIRDVRRVKRSGTCNVMYNVTYPAGFARNETKSQDLKQRNTPSSYAGLVELEHCRDRIQAGKRTNHLLGQVCPN